MTKKQLIQRVNNIQWEWDWGRKFSPLFSYAVVCAWTKARQELSGQVNNVILFSKNYYTNFFVNIKDLNQAGKKAYELSTQKGFINFYECEARRACQKLIKLSKFDKTGDLLSQYNNWLNAYVAVLEFVAHIRIFNRIGEKKIREFINSKIKNSKKQVEIFSILSATTRINAFDDFHKKITLAYQKKTKNNLILEQIVRDFKWMPVGYGDEPEWTIKDIKKQSQSFRPIKPNKIDKSLIIKKLVPNREILNLIAAIDLFVYYKDYLRRICNYCHYYSRPIFIALGKRYNLSLQELKMLLPKEIGKVKPNKGNILFSDKGKIYKFNYDEKLENEFFTTNDKSVVGTVANTGKVKGVVVVVNNPKDLKKDYNNRILVSVMTTPDITIAIKKAKAIITDEGGITCHAAIISRELGIPCIIGTKIATHVLKDGDLVEVDADKGIVKKI
ncbi:hypothetical protein A3B87_00635 [Candidatus Kuenenbacteria bacterium RIFCSPHIGHO2_02_FULL_39_13]|uniref:PEP-utilising enzyme mobile domain-containing protein n=1 Tax=Candidatus Kuenenbacteria bacterium RIFCSPHIGHO2_02_FULL_39_13 TaxID=1798561 RepID=A0A1F6FP31_9BACT|nr:MAG: hypothetical protein A3B87_00635 [Candidatus Kuenenbacteria bacterium RIFCSPHIGHO2_02_FULL_39_13]